MNAAEQERFDRIMLAAEHVRLVRERLDAAAQAAAESLAQLATELQVMNLQEQVEFAELEDGFWASYRDA